MMIYNEFRPVTFDEVVGQEVSVQIMRNQAKSDNPANAFIVTGIHGTGKTTIAKIFGRALNCEHPVNGNPCNTCSSCKDYFSGKNYDIIEIDAASKNSVDDIRDIQKELMYQPQRKKKVYVFDEVHMLTNSAWNSFLKTIEEPPANVVFVFCTTEINKIPDTIKSRCMRLDLQRIPNDEIYKNIENICNLKGCEYDEEGLYMISNLANGSMRDALSLLEKCISYGELTYTNISDVLGIVDVQSVIDIINDVISNKITRALNTIEELFRKGKDLNQLVADMMRVVRNIMIAQSCTDPELFDMNVEYFKDIKMSTKDCYYMINELSKLMQNIKNSETPKVLVDIYLMQISQNVSASFSEDSTVKEPVKAKEPVSAKAEPKVENKAADTNVNAVEDIKKNEKVDELNHNNYLHYKVDLIRSYDINSPELTALLSSQIFTRKDAFVIRTTAVDILIEEDITKRLKDITGKDLSVKVFLQK